MSTPWEGERRYTVPIQTVLTTPVGDLSIETIFDRLEQHEELLKWLKDLHPEILQQFLTSLLVANRLEQKASPPTNARLAETTIKI